MYIPNTGILPAPGQNPLAGITAQANTQGSEQCQTLAYQVGKPANDFLTAVFKPVHISDYDPLYSKENYNFLYDSARNYARLLGKEFNLAKRYRDFEKLYDTFRGILPADQKCEITQHEGELMFHVVDDREEGNLYYVPCEIIDRVEGALRDIYLCFFRLFRQSQGLSPLLEDPCFEMICGDLPDRELTEEDDGWLHMLYSYQKGEICKTLELVDEEPQYTIRQLGNRIKKYVPQSEKESKILSLMLEGLELFRQGKPIMKYGFFPYEDSDFYDTYYPVQLDRIILILYNTDDGLFENLFEWTCEEANQGGYDILSGGDLLITPQTKKLLKPDVYVEQFLKWINRFCHELND